MTDEEQSSSESALQLFARLEDRPSLLDMEPNLFLHGPVNKEIIEVVGECGVGKTLLMKHLTRKCIMPKHHCGIAINGLEAGVVYFNNDLHFNVKNFRNYLLQYLADCIPDTVPEKEEAVKIISESSLKRLTVINIYDSETMYIMFHVLKNYLITNDYISLIIIDSICANYWQDRMADGIRKMDSYILHVLSCLHKCIEHFKVSVIFTRPSYFQTKTNTSAEDVSAVYNLLKINTSIRLIRSIREGEPSYHANVKTSKGCWVRFYSIGPKGINWS